MINDPRYLGPQTTGAHALHQQTRPMAHFPQTPATPRPNDCVSNRIRRVAAFTLIELMVVVALVGIVAGLAAPSIADSLAERKTNETALDIVSIARRGRSEAVGYGRAHMFSWDDGAQEFTLHRGTNNRCNAVNWAAISGGGCVTATCRAQLRMADSSSSGNVVTARWQARAGSDVDLCFEPSGRVLWRSGLPRFSDRNLAGPEGNLQGGVVFEVLRDGGTEGVIRRVVIPLGGDARLLR